MSKIFIYSLMDHIMEATMIPKAQIERAVGPILGMFLGDVLTETLRGDPDLSGPLQVICREFPLKKLENRQSTNIDWLLVNTHRKQLIFLELKTSDTSVNFGQNAIYLAKQKEVRTRGGSFLIEDLQILRNASKESGKYHYILEEKVMPFQKEIETAKDAKILYLVPHSAALRVRDHADKVLTFGMLSKSIPGPFAEEWRVVRSHLCELDESSQQSRNLRFTQTMKLQSSENFAEKCDFPTILELCEERGDAILVGFAGGVNQLASRDISYLKNRKYKWDKASRGTGKKDLQNWIHGSTFVRLIKNKEMYSKSSPNIKRLATVKRSSNWQGTFKFDDMVAHCLEHGDDIVIGFTGGKTAFAQSTLLKLKQRSHYKWDYAKNLSGKKQSDWLPGGTVIALLKRHHYYPKNSE